MGKTATLNIRVNPDVKENAESVLAQLGIPMCADIPDDEPDPDERRAVCFYPEYDAPDQRKGETDVFNNSNPSMWGMTMSLIIRSTVVVSRHSKASLPLVAVWMV